MVKGKSFKGFIREVEREARKEGRGEELDAYRAYYKSRAQEALAKTVRKKAKKATKAGRRN